MREEPTQARGDGGGVHMCSENTDNTSIAFTFQTTGNTVQRSPRANRDRSNMSKKVLQDHKWLKNIALCEFLVSALLKDDVGYTTFG